MLCDSRGRSIGSPACYRPKALWDRTEGSTYAVALFLATGFGGFFDALRAFISSDKSFLAAADIPWRLTAACFCADPCFCAFNTAALRLFVASMIRCRPSGDSTRFPAAFVHAPGPASPSSWCCGIDSTDAPQCV